MRASVVRVGVLLLFLAGSAWPPASGWAGDWYVVPQIDAGVSYDTNLNFSYGRKKNDFIFNLSPALDLKFDSETTRLTGRLDWVGLVYVKNPSLDIINQYYSGSFYRRLLPRLAFTISGGYTLDATLREELLASGYVMNRTRRQGFQVAPGLEFSLTERALLRVGYGYSGSLYQDPRYTDYFTHRVNLGLNYLLKNAKTTLTVAGWGRYSEYPRLGNFYRNLGLYGGLEHKFSEEWLISLAGGANFNWFTSRFRVLDLTFFPDFILVRQVPEDSFTITPFFQVQATRRWPKTNLTFGYTADQSPTAAGSLSQFHSGSAGISHRFTEKLTGGLTGSLYYTHYTSPGSDYESLVFYLRPDLKYNLTEKLAFNCSYQLGLREDTLRNRSTDRHVFWISLSYAYPLGYKK